MESRRKATEVVYVKHSKHYCLTIGRKGYDAFVDNHWCYNIPAFWNKILYSEMTYIPTDMPTVWIPHCPRPLPSVKEVGGMVVKANPMVCAMTWLLNYEHSAFVKIATSIIIYPASWNSLTLIPYLQLQDHCMRSWIYKISTCIYTVPSQYNE